MKQRKNNVLSEKQKKEVQHILVGGLISLVGLATTIAAQLIVALNGRDIPRAPEVRPRTKDKRVRRKLEALSPSGRKRSSSRVSGRIVQGIKPH